MTASHAEGASRWAEAGASLHKDGARRQIRRVLIANRGEIALRIIRACRDAGVESVVVFSDADAQSLPVRLADAAVHIGAASPVESYLAMDRVLDAARVSGADAVHPGYGFLSERAAFAEAVQSAGLVWIGPRPETIAAVGDKLAARRLAAAVGVPVVPGTLEPARIGPDTVAALESDADRVGYPLFVKAAAGGGGRGMRRVESRAELASALVAGSREAAAAFGDGSVYLEREIRPARHVEVQLLGDRSGRVIALGERDCSIQRRNQKLVEEAPAPLVSSDARRELHRMAVRLGEAAGLENAATAEFLLDTDGGFWFLEVNTRLQVEHGVTELVAHVDIVAEQLRLASGMELSQRARDAAERAADPDVHAIEVRLSAEDPARAFAPSPGRIGRWQMPAGPGVRVDTAVQSGDEVRPDYDPLIAKLLVVAETRPAAISRLRRALAEIEVTGIQTTLPFHRAVAMDAVFACGELSTDFVAEQWDATSSRSDALRRAAAAAAAAVAGPHAARSASARGLSLRKDTSAGAWLASGRRAATERWPR